MSRIAAKVLTICLLAVPTVAFASVYPFDVSHSPDLQVAENDGPVGYSYNAINLAITDNTDYGDVITIIDPGTPCAPAACGIFPPSKVSFNSDAAGFTITGPSSVNPSAPGTVTYLAGSYVPGSCYEGAIGDPCAAPTSAPADYGELFTITSDNVPEWSALEEANCPYCTTPWQAFDLADGALIAFDFDTETDDGDMELYNLPPTATPEPASLTLLGSGLVAGLLRKRLARKKK
jgi:hypothetical protein